MSSRPRERAGRIVMFARALIARFVPFLSAAALLGVVAPQTLADSPPASAPALDYALPDGHFFTQANGSPLGKSATGFLLADDGGIDFWRGYQKLGGVGLLGYPISGRFEQAGFVAQATQRGILQWQPKTSSVALTNIFDQLHDAGKDAWLQSTYQVPPPVALNEKGQTFTQVTQHRLTLLNGNPAIKARYLATPDAGDLYGLPTSAPVDFGPMIAVRFQRVVMQDWKVAEPWAKVGDVTLVNGGDVAKAAGLIPVDAIAAAAPPVLDGQPRSPGLAGGGRRRCSRTRRRISFRPTVRWPSTTPMSRPAGRRPPTPRAGSVSTSSSTIRRCSGPVTATAGQCPRCWSRNPQRR